MQSDSTSNRDAQARVYKEPAGTADRTLLLEQTAVDAEEILYWPSIVPVHAIDEVSDPLGDYYLYYSASHTDSSIQLAFADDPLGPYTHYGGVFEDPDAGPQTETPEVVWNPDAGRFHLYYHGFLGTNQSTALAFSGDGLEWEQHGVVLESPPRTAGNDHTGYARVHRFGDYWLAHHVMGGGGSSGFGVSYSHDGVEWRTDPRRLSHGHDVTGHPDKQVTWSHTRIVNRNGRRWWIGSIKPTDPWGEDEYGYVAWAPLVDERSFLAPPRPLVEPTADWEGDMAYTPDVLVEDDAIYVVYATRTGSIHAGGTAPANGHIGGARIEW